MLYYRKSFGGKILEEKLFTDDEVIAFIKFTDYADELLKGDLYMNNLNTFVEEGKEGAIGRGDPQEVANILKNSNLEFYLNGEKIAEAEAGRLIEQRTKNLFAPVYCMFAITGKDLIFESEDDEKIYVKIDIKNQEFHKFLREFSYSEAVVTLAAPFLDAIDKTFNERNYYAICNLVKYIDIDSTIENQYIDFLNNNELFFRKSNLFSHQREFRIVLPNEVTQNGKLVNIGNISSFSGKYKAKEILDSIRIGFPKK